MREKLIQPVSLINDNACSDLLEQPSSNHGEKSCLHSVYGVGEIALTSQLSSFFVDLFKLIHILILCTYASFGTFIVFIMPDIR